MQTPFRLDGRHALVTGGASGIGENTCRVLAAAGASVIIADIDRPRAEALAAEIGASILLFDVTDEAAVNAAFAGIPKLDILVNSAGIGLVGYAQIDPKTEYKRVGMKEFDTMWEGLSDKATDIVFRMEDDEAFAETVWTIGQMVHESAPRLQAPEGSIQAQQQAAIEGSQQTDKKQEPIRNRGDKVGRNEPCPCGSGKKYKNCHMRGGK